MSMTLLDIVFGTFAIGFSLWRLAKRSRFFVHTFQLFGYKNPAFLSWLNDHIRDAILRRSHMVGVCILILGWLLPIPAWGLFLMWAIAFASSKRYRRDKPKKGLVWTPRVKRLSLLGVVLMVVVWTLAFTAPIPSPINILLGFWLIDFTAPFVVALASILAAPIEKAVQEGFKKQARAQLARRPDLKVVAITGSYGKTSVKFAIKEILSQRFPTLATPGSFNTPMGICRVVNDELTDEHAIVVLEMGMRHPGDIAELCQIASPDIAVITSVGPAHLEYMGSIEAIAEEKSSLLSYLTPEGTAILNGDDPFVLKMQEKVKGRVIIVSTQSSEADLYANDISYDSTGARFTVHLASRAGEKANASISERFETNVLGRHNVLNVLLAVAVGHEYGLTLRQMSHAIERLEPVDHRLKLLERNGLLVLDDAFNSNPVGAANAVEVLGGFAKGRKIVITPGMIELGDQEAELNRIFGTQIAKHADDVILVGPKRTEPIAQGLRKAGFPSDRVHVVLSLFEGQEWIAKNTVPGDVVLYENDLPDQFNEV